MPFPLDACKTSRHFLVCLLPALLVNLCTKSLGIMKGDPALDVLYLISGVVPGCVNAYLGVSGAIDAKDELRYMRLIWRTCSSVATFHMMIRPSPSEVDFCFGSLLTILIVILLMFMQAHLSRNKIDVASTAIDAMLVVIFSGVKLLRAHLDNGDGQLAYAVLFLLPAFSAVILGVSMAVRSAGDAVLEWQVRYMEATFDAAFCVHQSKEDTNLRISSHSEKLDTIFKRPMEGQVLNELTVLHGLESLEKLNPSMTNKSFPQSTSIHRMFVTCLDADGLEFDCEMCSSPTNHRDGVLVGLRAIGEKRPHGHGARTEAAPEDETTAVTTKRKNRRIPTISSVGGVSDMEGLDSPEVEYVSEATTRFPAPIMRESRRLPTGNTASDFGEYVSEATTRLPAPIMRESRRLPTGNTASDFGETWAEQELDGPSATPTVMTKTHEVLRIPCATPTWVEDNALSPISEASTRKASTVYEMQLGSHVQLGFGSDLREEVLTTATVPLTGEHRPGIMRRRGFRESREVNSSDIENVVKTTSTAFKSHQSWPLQRFRKTKSLKREPIVETLDLPWWNDSQEQLDQNRQAFCLHE